MRITKETLRHLNTERDQRIQSAVDCLKNGNTEGAQSELAWIDIYSHALDSARRRTRWRLWFFGAICLAIFGIVCALPFPRTQLTLDMETETLTLTLKEDWASRYRFVTDEIFINNLLEVRASGFGLPDDVYRDTEGFAAELKGESFEIGELVFMADAKIEMNVEGDKLRFFVKDSPIGGDISVQKANFTEIGDNILDAPLRFEPPETVRFRSDKKIFEPVRCEFVPKSYWEFRGLQVREMGFLEEYPPGTGRFESVINGGGKLILPQIGFGKELREGDNLILEGVESRRLDISKGKKGIKIYFEGSVKGVHAGPQGFENDFTVRFLEWVYHQKPLAIVWTAVFIVFFKIIRDAFFNLDFDWKI